MTEQQMLELAAEYGFQAAWMDVDELNFQPGLRSCCEENTCGRYDLNYGCPPYCGTPDEMEAKAKAYKRVLILQTISPVDDVMDPDQTRPLKQQHNILTREFLKEMKRKEVKGLAAMAGPCSLCSPCRCEMNLPCAFPDQVSSCLSAYCILISEAAEKCGMECWCEDGRVAFFSLWFVSKRKEEEITCQ